MSKAWKLITLTNRLIAFRKNSNRKRREKMKTKMIGKGRKPKYEDEVRCHKCRRKLKVNEKVWRRTMHGEYSKTVYYCKSCYGGLWI